MPALPWKWVLFVWGYAIIRFLVSDRIKLLGYRILDAATPPADRVDRLRGPHARPAHRNADLSAGTVASATITADRSAQDQPITRP